MSGSKFSIVIQKAHFSFFRDFVDPENILFDLQMILKIFLPEKYMQLIFKKRFFLTAQGDKGITKFWTYLLCFEY